MNDALLFPSSSGSTYLCEEFLFEVVAGLSRPQKTLPCKFLYDEDGSRIFNEICELEEYYPTRTENQILRDNIVEISSLIGSECRLVEFGSGSSTKTRHLLANLPRMCGYVPIDISEPQLLESSLQLASEFPCLEINPLAADYNGILEIPEMKRKPRRTVAFFPGSTIGNFDPVAAIAFMRNIASICGRDGGLLIGVDRKKPRRILEPAYNDRNGVTARFNLGILARANRELGANFDLSAFRHRAPYNEEYGRIEMQLVSERAQTVNLDSQEFRFEVGECITTEHSYKYTPAGFAALAWRAGFEVVRNWSDRNHLFSVMYLRVRNRKPGPKKISPGFKRAPCKACGVW